MFDPEYADAVESGDMFACDICHDFVCDSADANHCPTCHVGACSYCGVALEVADVGDRDFEAPEYMLCKPCYRKENAGPEAITVESPFSLMAQLKAALS